MSDLDSKPLEPLRVFIADDSRLVHRYLRLLLEMTPGVQFVGSAFTTDDTINGVHKQKPDVLILDIEMPPHSGLEVLKAMPFDESRPATFILTLHDSPVLNRYARSLGADCFFNKEDDFPLLMEVIIHYAAQTPPRVIRESEGRDYFKLHAMSSTAT